MIIFYDPARLETQDLQDWCLLPARIWRRGLVTGRASLCNAERRQQPNDLPRHGKICQGRSEQKDENVRHSAMDPRPPPTMGGTHLKDEPPPHGAQGRSTHPRKPKKGRPHDGHPRGIFLAGAGAARE